MKKISALLGCLFVLLCACSPQEATATPVDVSALQIRAAQTFIAGVTQTTAANVPTGTPTLADTPISTDTSGLPSETPALPIPTNMPINTFAPLYWELTWENLGRSDKELDVDIHSSERVTLSGYAYQTPEPVEKNDLRKNVGTFYSTESMASMGWMAITGWGGVSGVEMEYYNKAGYFLTVRLNAQPRTIIVWMSDKTTIAPPQEFTPTVEPIEETVLLPTPTNTLMPSLAPLYGELSWENLGRFEQDILLDGQTYERVTLSGYKYQASLPANDNAYAYYSNENMKNMGWMFVNGWGETAEFYNEAGYFLTVTFAPAQSHSIAIWISDQTGVIPVIPIAQN